MQILMANPRGFCAGVDRAISIVERALEIYGAPIYVRHEVVHNRYVVDDLRQRGAIFIEEISEVPDGSILIFLRMAFPKLFVKKLALAISPCYLMRLVLWLRKFIWKLHALAVKAKRLF